MESGKKQTSHGVHLVKKVVKPLLRLLHRRRCQQQLKAMEEDYVPVSEVPVWQADLSAEISDNSINEALEARLKELIVASPHAEVSRGQLQLKVAGTLTLRPVRRVRFAEEVDMQYPAPPAFSQRSQSVRYRRAQPL
ncbi:hypothetical protein FJT64_014596 [Amphibalanus amphitrite]|uniref:Uncharacterized protein n=1 Tax=Amphibalanus amphitrite TaxID=1232801 RepID=A0A6A4V9F6_AMPAM|nr:hypothetical protein FJT64_014596 [Amphibalanus amphitrite]